MPEHDLQQVASFFYPFQAHLARVRLEQEGIRAFVADEAVATMNWLYTNAIGGVTVFVAAQDATQARQVLDEIHPQLHEVDDTLPLPDPRCPQCNSAEVAWEPYWRQACFLSWIALGMPLPVRRPW